MTKRIGNLLIISAENHQQCDFCNEIAELRPYGSNNETICFDCAMKHIKTSQRKFKKLLNQ